MAPETTSDTAPTLDEEAPTPDTVIVRSVPNPRPRARAPSDRLITITETVINSRGCVIVKVDSDEGIFETVFYTRRELRSYLRGLDHMAFPAVLQLPAKWQALLQ